MPLAISASGPWARHLRCAGALQVYASTTMHSDSQPPAISFDSSGVWPLTCCQYMLVW